MVLEASARAVCNGTATVVCVLMPMLVEFAVPYVLGLSLIVGEVDVSLLNRTDSTPGQDHDVRLRSERTSLTV